MDARVANQGTRWGVGRLRVLGFAVLTALPVLQVFLQSNAGIEWRLRMAAMMSGYDGCMCGDCTQSVFGLSVRRYGCGCAQSGGDLACWTTLISAVLFMIGGPGWRGLQGPRRDVGRCDGCGYPREGLDVGAVCPECGVGVGGGHDRPSTVVALLHE